MKCNKAATELCYSQMRDDQLLASIVSETSAQYLLNKYGNLKEVFLYTYQQELERIPGIGKTKASQLKAIAELVSRIIQGEQKTKIFVRSPKDIMDLVSDMQLLRVEQFRVLYFNTKNRLMHMETITQGTINATVITPREIFSPAVRLLASSVALVHNHPSGDPAPSFEDKEVTQRIVESGEALGISVLDHVIVGTGSYYSFKEQGMVL
ncbi:RadC family protein [Brevibacillus sp. AG162]|uniref:RadC family protein n=1 Tax=unclassified Brevibacillus TaxID=2684853 RepID=UPI001150C38F|nr:DNA repair protein RadC [Brevibacillus sp. AG162]TQK53303.1 DNA repair protein RadC [Brevibacillus sp. AG162]